MKNCLMQGIGEYNMVIHGMTRLTISQKKYILNLNLKSFYLFTNIYFYL